MLRLRSWWDRYEGPTWGLAAVIYGSWLGLTWFHARIAWWLLFPLGAFVTAWHASLQHETIHALVRVPRRLRIALAWLPLGLGYPYRLYVREHRLHHRNELLTDPRFDPESFYHPAARWQAYHPALRAVLLANQTLLGRLIMGAPLSLAALALAEIRRLRGGDRSHLGAWAEHGIATAVVLGWVCGVAHVPWWQYAGCFALPGLSLGMLRTLIEHRWAPNPAHRTAIVENDFPFGLLFLYNNLHAVHHESPALPWFKLRAAWRSLRGEILRRNGGFYFRGYRALLRQWLVRPTFVPQIATEPANL